MKKLKTYFFDVHLLGIGANKTEAWNDCVSGFAMEPGPAPKPTRIEPVDDGIIHQGESHDLPFVGHDGGSEGGED